MLLALIILLCTLTVYGIMTNPMSEEERNEMLNDEEMWP
jgi:hypothetical protein